MIADALKALGGARGESCQVLIVFIDIRGFSTFAGVAESTDTAIFLRDMYTTAIQEYFADATYFKPTGDGLMIVHELPPNAEEVTARFRKTVNEAQRFVGDFASLTDDNVLITIRVPERVGIGISRGSATRLVSEDGEILDYSGRCLNLAARLMDLARPQGVVLSDKHANVVLSAEQLDALAHDEVYIKGVSEDTLVEIWLTPDWVAIPDVSRQPIAYKPSFDRATDLTAETIRTNVNYGVRMSREPRKDANIMVAVEFSCFAEDGSKSGTKRSIRLKAVHIEEPEGPYARVSLGALKTDLGKHNVPDDATVRMTPFH